MSRSPSKQRIYLIINLKPELHKGAHSSACGIRYPNSMVQHSQVLFYSLQVLPQGAKAAESVSQVLRDDRIGHFTGAELSCSEVYTFMLFDWGLGYLIPSWFVDRVSEFIFGYSS